jgi:hypothetical protein
MAEDAFEARVLAGNLPPLSDKPGGDAETLARIVDRLAASVTALAAMRGGRAGVTVNIATPDTEVFRRSEAYLAGQIARAVTRGQRVL